MLERLQTLSDEWMQHHEGSLVQRVAEGKIRDVHGDLRLEHVFLFPEQAIPNDIVILDGIEFSPSLRQIDIVADIAFLVMELSFVGRRVLTKNPGSHQTTEQQERIDAVCERKQDQHSQNRPVGTREGE